MQSGNETNDPLKSDPAGPTGPAMPPSVYGSFLCNKPPIYMGLSYVLLHPFYIRWSLIYRVSDVLLWVHFMYTNYCGVLLLYIRWSLKICS